MGRPRDGPYSGRPGPGHSFLTLRALILGTVAVVGVSIMVCLSEYRVHSFRMELGHVTFGAMMFFFLVVTVGNGTLKLLNRAWALRPEELLIVFIMAMLAGLLQATGMTSYLVAILATPYCFASPENQLAKLRLKPSSAPRRLMSLQWSVGCL